LPQGKKIENYEATYQINLSFPVPNIGDV